MKVYRYFYQRDQAEAFVAGVEFVNDSAIEVLEIRPVQKGEDYLQGFVVVMEDKDAFVDVCTDDCTCADRSWHDSACPLAGMSRLEDK